MGVMSNTSDDRGCSRRRSKSARAVGADEEEARRGVPRLVEQLRDAVGDERARLLLGRERVPARHRPRSRSRVSRVPRITHAAVLVTIPRLRAGPGGMQG